jgi:UDP-GlcNAc:undecaprenyl-phosphate GlcNAc-1-phosphate transferase
LNFDLTGDGSANGLLLLVAQTFLISVALTPIARDIFRAYNLMDKPGARKMHRHPTPRVGGIPVAVAYGVALLSIENGGADVAFGASTADLLLPAGTLMFLVGLVDDMLTLTPWVKLIGQILAAAVAFWSGIRIESLAGFELPWVLSAAFSLGWLLLCTNALNLIDGLDGLCTGMGMIGAMVFCIAGGIGGNPELGVVTLPLVAALAGFLFHNFNPATVFLGDSGALTIGFVLGCFGILWSRGEGGPMGIALPILAIAIPLLDLGLSIIRRFVAGKPIFGADRGHMHHRLLDLRLNTRQAVMVLYTIAGSAGAIALLLISRDSRDWWFWLVASWLVFLSLVVRWLRYVEFEAPGELITARGWREGLQAHRQLRSSVRRLRKAASEEELWSTLTSLASGLGWTQISWLPSAATAPSTPAAPRWIERIEIDKSHSLIIEGADSRFRPGPRTLSLLAEALAFPLRNHAGWARVTQAA